MSFLVAVVRRKLSKDIRLIPTSSGRTLICGYALQKMVMTSITLDRFIRFTRSKKTADLDQLMREDKDVVTSEESIIKTEQCGKCHYGG